MENISAYKHTSSIYSDLSGIIEEARHQAFQIVDYTLVLHN